MNGRLPRSVAEKMESLQALKDNAESALATAKQNLYINNQRRATEQRALIELKQKRQLLQQKTELTKKHKNALLQNLNKTKNFLSQQSKKIQQLRQKQEDVSFKRNELANKLSQSKHILDAAKKKSTTHQEATKKRTADANRFKKIKEERIQEAKTRKIAAQALTYFLQTKDGRTEGQFNLVNQLEHAVWQKERNERGANPDILKRQEFRIAKHHNRYNHYKANNHHAVLQDMQADDTDHDLNTEYEASQNDDASTLQELNDTMEHAQSNIADLEDQVHATDASNSHIEDQLNAETQLLHNNEDTIQDTEQQLNSTNQEISSIDTTIEQLDQHIDDKEYAYEQAAQDQNYEHQEIDTAQNEVDRLDQEIQDVAHEAPAESDNNDTADTAQTHDSTFNPNTDDIANDTENQPENQELTDEDLKHIADQELQDQLDNDHANTNVEDDNQQAPQSLTDADLDRIADEELTNTANNDYTQTEQSVHDETPSLTDKLSAPLSNQEDHIQNADHTDSPLEADDAKQPDEPMTDADLDRIADQELDEKSEDKHSDLNTQTVNDDHHIVQTATTEPETDQPSTENINSTTHSDTQTSMDARTDADKPASDTLPEHQSANNSFSTSSIMDSLRNASPTSIPAEEVTNNSEATSNHQEPSLTDDIKSTLHNVAETIIDSAQKIPDMIMHAAIDTNHELGTITDQANTNLHAIAHWGDGLVQGVKETVYDRAINMVNNPTQEDQEAPTPSESNNSAENDDAPSNSF